MPQQPSRGIDDPLLARLERLAQRRAESQPFPPPRGAMVDAPIDRLTPMPRTRRRHPARGARIGALVVSCASTGALSYLFASSGGSDSQSTALAGLPAPIATSSTASTVPASSSVTTVPATAVASPGVDPATTVPATTVPATTVPVTAGQSGVFDGSVVNTRYGPVQVQVQITNGSLTEVAVIQYPDGDGKSVRINQRALPTLRTEALAAQSANVDTVSGATYTSDGYAQSLQSALDAAQAAGIEVAA